MPPEFRASDGDRFSLEWRVGHSATTDLEAADDGVLVARVAGDLDFVVTPSLRRRLVGHLDGSVAVLVVDLSRVTLLSVAAIEMLLDVVALAGELAVSVRIVAMTRAVRRPLLLTGVDCRLPLFASLADALDPA